MAAASAAGKDLGLEESVRPEVDHDTQNTAGMADIIATILDKISQSAVFVADVTPVGKAGDGKALPNPNVLIELGWAMKALGTERIIAVLNTASGFRTDDLPFDIRHRRILPYHLEEGADSPTRVAAKKSFTAGLTDALKINLAEHIQEIVAAAVIPETPANPNNRSIWATAKDRIELHDYFVTGSTQSVSFPDCPRAYIRIIPSGWQYGGPPSVNDIGKLQEPFAVAAPLEGGSSGNFGACEEGFVRYWDTGRNPQIGPETRNATMYFDATGEFWTVHGTAVEDYKYGPTLRHQAVLIWWARSLKAALAVLDTFGASPLRRVEAGLFGVRGVRWPGTWQSDSPVARKNSFYVERKSRDWDEDARLAFLTAAYAEVTNLFSLARPTTGDTLRLINSYT